VLVIQHLLTEIVMIPALEYLVKDSLEAAVVLSHRADPCRKSDWKLFSECDLETRVCEVANRFISVVNGCDYSRAAAEVVHLC